MSASLLIAGGGTGGHLFPGLAVASALRQLRPDLRLAFVSAGRALESRELARAGLPLERLRVRALRGAGWLGRLRALAAVLPAVWQARGLVRRYRPGLVLAVGGYACFPLGLAAFLGRVPLAVQEQNAVPGLSNRLLSHLARVVFISFPAAERSFPRGKARLTGNPVRPELLERLAQCAPERTPAQECFTVLVLGGSQGAHSLNQALMQALPELARRRERLRFFHQTGPADQAQVEAAYRRAGFQARVEAFFSDMGRLYALAHLVICRAGAGTLTEVLAAGRAAVCVPYPFAAGDHQTANAQALVEAGAARLVPDRELDGPRVAALIAEFMDNPEHRRGLEKAAAALARPRAARDIAQACLQLMKEAA